MKTARQWFEQLPEPYRTQAINNSGAEMLIYEYESGDDAIRASFNWQETPQGFEYWQHCVRFKVPTETAQKLFTLDDMKQAYLCGTYNGIYDGPKEMKTKFNIDI